MTLAALLEKQFRADLRFRGQGYVKAERVSIRLVRPDHIEAVVRDGVDHLVRIDRTDGKLSMHCTCDQFQKLQVCKHLWAVILTIDAEGLLSSEPTPGHIPPFVAEEEEDWTAADDLDEGELLAELAAVAATRGKSDFLEDIDDDGEDDFPGGNAGGVATAVGRRQKVADWERPLVDLAAELKGEGRKANAEAREREIFFEIDRDASVEEGVLVMQLSQRQRRVNGQWGKLKALKLRPTELDKVEHEDDRTVLAYLLGGTPDRSDWVAQKTESNATVSRFQIPHELSVRLMPMLAASGRMRYLDSDEPQPLAWDDGDPWELTAAVEPADPGDGDGESDPGEPAWTLAGQLHRGDEVLPLGDVLGVVRGGLVLFEDRVTRLRDYDAFEWTRILDGRKVTAPPEGGIALVDRMLDMPALPRLSLPPELQLEEVRLEPKRILTVSGPRPDQGPFGERLLGTVTFGYDDARVSGSSQRWAVVQRDRRRCLVRDEQAEAAAWEAVLDAGFRRRLDDAGGPNVEVSARDLGRAVRDLVDADWEVRADGRPVSRPTELNFRVKSDIDWFELHADFDFEGRTAALPEVLAALRRGDGTVRLDDGSLGLLPEEWAARFGLLGGLGAATDDHIRFNANQVSLLDAMLDEQQSVQFDEPFEELRERFRNFEGVEPATEPDGFQGELRGYQREGLGWLEFLREFRLNGCLADDMGLGKTVQLLALLERRRAEGHSEPSLVVVPKSLMFNWEQEARRFTPDIKLLEYTGTDRDGLLDEIPKVDLVLTTYGTLRRDVVKLKEIRFDYIVLDEAQTIKNAGSQVAKASRLLKARQRLALSGTPIENHLGDLWSIFEFLNPGMLGRSSLFKSIAGPGSEDEATRQVLGKALRPFILRRTKQQVAGDLPEKSEQVLLCDMEAEQRKIYDDLLDHYRGALLGKVKKEGLEKSRMHVLEALLRLRQAACHPALLESGEPTDASAKTDVLLPQLEELLSENHKALVFSQFTSMLAVVRAQLDKAGIKYEYLDGKTRDREARVEKFQNDPATGVFLISLKAGGLGLNLTAADYVFLLDPWWNPAVEAQAVDRAHRLGQTRHVFAYRLICRDTVEEKIAELQKQKRELAGALLEEDRGGLGQLTVEDLEKLLS